MQHDTLDLDQLRAYIKADALDARHYWIKIALVVVLLFALGFIFFFMALRYVWWPSRWTIFVVYSALMGGAIPIVVGIGSYYLRRERSKRQLAVLEQYQPLLDSLNLPPAINERWSKGTFILMGATILGIVLMIVLSVYPLLALGLGLFIPMLISIPVWLLPLTPLSKGNYDETIRRAQTVRHWFRGNIGALNQEGLGHLFAGHPVESENVHRMLIAQTLNRKLMWSLGLNNYACELMYQKRYEEALPLLEAAIVSQPQFLNSYLSLAGWYLDQNLSSERALDLIELGLTLPAQRLTPFKAAALSVRLASRALAEARNGLVETRARLTLGTAFQEADSKKIPHFADMNLTAGETYLALNDIPLARQHFAKAAEVDPNGRIGKMARERLQTLPPEPAAT